MADELTDLARLRNDFYRDNFRRVILVLILSLILNIVLSMAASWLFLNRPQPIYYATSTDGKLIRMIPLNEPFVKNEQVLAFATQAAIASTSFDFLNYEANLAESKKFFTNNGFDSFLGALNSSGNLARVKERDLVAKGIITGVPTIIKQGQLGRRYTWRVEVPMTILYESASDKFRQNVLLSMLVSRVSTADTAAGIQVSRYSLTPRASEIR